MKSRHYTPTVAGGLKLLADIHKIARDQATTAARKARTDEADKERRERANQPARVLSGGGLDGGEPARRPASTRNPDGWLSQNETTNAWIKAHFG